MAFVKDNLANAILNCEEITYDDLLRMARGKNFPNFEVRTIGSAGLVQIKFPNQGWIDPVQWANNHVTTIIKCLHEAADRLSSLEVAESRLNENGFYSSEALQSRVVYAAEMVTGTFKFTDPEAARHMLIKVISESILSEDDPSVYL